jgi:hypothetical protein
MEEIVGWVTKTKNGDPNYQRAIDLIHFVKTICGRIDMYVPEHKCYILQIHSDCCKLLKIIQSKVSKQVIKKQSWKKTLENSSVNFENDLEVDLNLKIKDETDNPSQVHFKEPPAD